MYIFVCVLLNEKKTVINENYNLVIFFKFNPFINP